jgi:hypothetical protein
MSTLSIHPIEYLRLHLHYDEISTRLITPLKLLLKKVFELSEEAATIAVVLFTLGLVIFSCMIIVQSASLAASYDAAIPEIVLSSLQAIPTVM